MSAPPPRDGILLVVLVLVALWLVYLVVQGDSLGSDARWPSEDFDG